MAERERRPLLASELQSRLAELVSEHGDLAVFFADGYDNAIECRFCSVLESPAWEGAPDGKAVYLS